MKIVTLLLILLVSAAAQNQPAISSATPDSGLQETLQKIDQSAQAAALDIARLRIDKWKTESEIKHQSQSNADSISRNLTTALPAILSAARANPRDLSATFKLYRNLNALYDVFEGLAESAGAFGTKQEFEALSRHVQDLDAYRRAVGDYFETLAAAKESELARTRAASAPSSAPSKPKKIIVDNDLASKSSKKKQ